MTLIEARARLGGRLNTVTMAASEKHKLDEVSVDLGGTFVHGCKDREDNLVYRMVVEHQEKVKQGIKLPNNSAFWGEPPYLDRYCPCL